MITIHRTEGTPRRHNGCLWAALIAIVLYVVLNIFVGVAFTDLLSSSSTASLTDHTVYKLELKGVLVEQAPEEDPFAALWSQMPMAGEQENKVGLDQLLSNIRLAKDDARVDGIYLHGGELAVAPASAKTIRDALLDFKQSGKWIIAYADAYTQTNYYIASVADRIYLNPVGMVDWRGLCASKMYFTRLLEKIGVQMQVVKVGTFKSAVEPFILTAMSDADRRQTEVYLHGIWDNMVSEVASSRHLTEYTLRELANQHMGLQSTQQVQAAGLVDSLVYTQSMDSILRDYTGTKDYTILSTSKMASVKRKTTSSANHIAVVYADGQIYDEGNEGIVTKKMLKTLRQVQKDKDIKAVVFRVNSPGGSANASEQIWHAVRLLQEQGLPVVVSMGDYAASGGYYISCEADYIIAEPTTLTGSIGIFGLIPNFSQLRQKVGIDMDEVHTSTHAALETNMVMKGMNPAERQLMQSMVERGYDLFTSRCAQGRHMSQDAIKRIGEGRVWLGQDALRLGLVDSLGNMDDAIVKAAELAQLTDYQLDYFPARKTFMDEWLQLLDNSTDEEKIIARLRAMVREPRVLTLAPVITIQ